MKCYQFILIVTSILNTDGYKCTLLVGQLDRGYFRKKGLYNRNNRDSISDKISFSICYTEIFNIPLQALST